MKLRTTCLYAFVPMLLIGHLKASAQKLPNEQKESVWAPANIKTDGKQTEWGSTLKAYNNATEIFYTLANDGENLYLTVQALKDPRVNVIGKILSGGITLRIKSKTKDKNQLPLTVTYPLIDRMKKSNINIMIRNTEANQDSMLTQINQQLEANSKEIALAGFKEITEPKISVYNEEGIKAAQLVDAKRTWTYELKLPLKYFKHLLDANGTFDYKIIVNGVVIPNEEAGMVVVTGRPINGAISINSGPAFDAFTPTDLSGTYTLAKK